MFCKCHHCVFHEYVITISNSSSEESNIKSSPNAGGAEIEGDKADINSNIDQADSVSKPKEPEANSNVKEVDVNSNTKDSGVTTNIDESESKVNATEAEVIANTDQPGPISNAETADINVLNELINPNDEPSNIET